MSDLKTRAAWCVNLARAANAEFDRMAEASAVAWCYRLGITHLETAKEHDDKFIAYMRSTQPPGWWTVPADNRCRPRQFYERYAKPVLRWVWA